MKLALNGQWKDLSGLIYTYPDKISGIPEWAMSLPDPRNVRGLFKGDYCYALWYNSNGYYYACTKTNTDSRNGCVMLTLFAEKNVPLNGKLLAEKMRLLLDYCLSKNDVSEIAYVDVSIKAKEIEGLLVCRDLPKEMSSSQDNDMAYRLYDNDDDLGLILENPNQPSYVGYKRILVIESLMFVVEALNAQSITKITEAVKRTYDIRSDSNEVNANKESVMEGETFTITYRKSGFIDETVEVIAGKPNVYCSINGNVINLKPASEVGVRFKSEVILKLVDEETNSPLKKWLYSIDGGPKTDLDKDEDGRAHFRIDPNKTHKIIVSAEGYESKEIEIAINERGLKTVKLCPAGDSIFVRLMIEKKEINGSVHLKPNNKLYRPLKWLDKENKVLVIKRSFFSLKNLLPILIAFAIAAAGGLFLGRATKPTPQTGIVNDSLKKANEELEEQLKDLKEIQTKDSTLCSALFSLYGDAINKVNEKSVLDYDKVRGILNQDEFNGVLSGKEKNKESIKICLEQLIVQLDDVIVQTNGGNSSQSGRSGNSVNNSDLPKKDDKDEYISDDLEYFKEHTDKWDLTKLKSKKYGDTFANSIKNGNIVNLIGFKGNGNSEDYYENSNWETICKKLNKFYNKQPTPTEDEKNMVVNAIKNSVSDNIFNLIELAESETLKSY
ncbi:MAG: hypothetical protein IKM85_04805 [Bacteroidales bacterium]|nr:hypothetical protein [Bacteroidales bacterium]